MGWIEPYTFKEKLLADDRHPLFTFDLRGLMQNNQFAKTTTTTAYGFYAPSLVFWGQLAVLLLVQAIASVLFGTLIYKFILITFRQQKRSKEDNKNDGKVMGKVNSRTHSSLSYLMGYGVVIPLAMYTPFVLIRLFDLRNKTLMMSVSTLPTAVVFKCLEAMYGYTPNAVSTSLGSYCLYHVSVVPIQWDKHTHKPELVSSVDIRRNATHAFAYMLTLGVVYSLTLPCNFEPFGCSEGLQNGRKRSDALDHGWQDVWRWDHLANNFLAAVMTFLTLSLGVAMVTLVVNIVTGYRTIDFMKNPLFASRSPSDFWGRRWNSIVQHLLKRGVFQPVFRVSSSYGIAAAITFLASGLLHEYVWCVIFYLHADEKVTTNSQACMRRICYEHVPGKSLMFFGYNGVIIVVEKLLSSATRTTALKHFIQTKMPQPCITMMVILLALPVSHWFTGDWIHGGYFGDFTVGLPVVRQVL